MSAGSINVLLADDDPVFLDALRALIDEQPDLHVVAAAHNGLEAIELADEHRPDAAVLDLHMPLVDGVAAVARLRHDHPTICLLALTGDSDPRLHRAVSEAGADAVLEKSQMMDALVERLADVRTSLRRPVG